MYFKCKCCGNYSDEGDPLNFVCLKCIDKGVLNCQDHFECIDYFDCPLRTFCEICLQRHKCGYCEHMSGEDPICESCFFFPHADKEKQDT